MYQLLVELKDFSAAHRLIKTYQGKCNHLHGHNYALRIVVAADTLSADDLVVDFSVVRKICNAWVQTHIDHCTLVYQDDQTLLNYLQQQAQKHYLFANNTTVECLAKEIYQQLTLIIDAENKRQKQSFYLQQVEVWESRECGVIYNENSRKLRGQICGE